MFFNCVFQRFTFSSGKDSFDKRLLVAPWFKYFLVILNMLTLSLIKILWEYQTCIRFFRLNTAWEVSVFGVFLVRLFPHLDWIRRVAEHLSVFSPNTGRYGPEKPRIQTFFTQCKIYIRLRSDLNPKSKRFKNACSCFYLVTFLWFLIFFWWLLKWFLSCIRDLKLFINSALVFEYFESMLLHVLNVIVKNLKCKIM